jgi:segregation and condensation protein A
MTTPNAERGPARRSAEREGGTPDAERGVEGFDSGLERFPVRLEVFEGPLDLLLHLIKKHEIDIHDIPIALVTRQYLEYLAMMEELQLDVAGDFLVMAATLIHIKSRSLLPRPAPEQEDPEEDPREALVRRLVEHQKFKAAAELLHDRETVRSAQWARPDERIAALAGEGLDKEPELEVDLFSLMTAFKAVVERAKQRPQVQLPMEQMSIEQRIDQLSARLEGVEAIGFEELFDDVAQRGDLIVTFLAVLEMIRLKVLRVFQSGAGGPIRVYKRERPADAPRPIEVHEHHHARPHVAPGSKS